MSEFRQYQARTLEVALSKAARDLGIPLDSVRYELVFDGRKGLFGFGQKDVVIRVDAEEMGRVRSSPPPPSDKPGVGPVGNRFPEERRSSARGPSEEGQGFDAERPKRPHRPEGGRPYAGGRRDDRPPRFERGRRDEIGGTRGGRGDAGGRGGFRGRRDDERPRRERGPDQGSAGPQWDPAAAPPLPESPPRSQQGQALLEAGRKLLQLMGFELDCAVEERATGNGRPEELVFMMRGPDDRLIIGRHGDVLDAFQYLVSRMFVRDPGFEGIRIAVDCAGYRHRHDQDLEDRARSVADRVRRSGEAVQLEPMNPYQRRVVHIALRDEPGIKTFSTGEGFLRRLTIGPTDPA